VPATSAQFSIVDAIYTRMGATDDLTAGMSTFLVRHVTCAGLVRASTRPDTRWLWCGGSSAHACVPHAQVEMSQTANILKGATERSLVILDELGRGTATVDGQAIARAVLSYMVGRSAAVSCCVALQFQ